MRTRKNRILAELRWRLAELRWRLTRLPGRINKLQRHAGGLRWHMGELRWQLAGLRKQRRAEPAFSGPSSLYRDLAELPWRLFENKRGWIAAGFVGISTIGGVATAVVKQPEEPTGIQTVVEKLAVFPEEIQLPSLPFVYDDRVGPGDTVQTIFRRLGILDSDALSFLQENPETASALGQLRTGDSLTAVVDVSGHLLSMRLPLSAEGDFLEISRSAAHLPFEISSPSAATLEISTEMRSGVINNSLFAATEAAGLPDSVASQLADLFGTEIDFHADLRRGDRFSVIYETFYDRGAPARAGRILAAEFINQGKRYAVFRHTAANKRTEYYSSTGQSLRSAFLRSPLEFSRVTSNFGRRLHPVLRNWRTHSGVDFGAPTGTPVRAVSDGVVIFMGRQGGYGNLVVLQHQDDISTAYAHLSVFASGLRRGDTVARGETIGQVGATGRATAPHLHYEFRINDVAQNPMTVALPDSEPLSGRELARFHENTRPLLAQLALLNYSIASAPQTD